MFEALHNYHAQQEQKQEHEANLDYTAQQNAYDALTSFHAQSLQLRRLLHCISSTQHRARTFQNNRTAVSAIPNRIIREQILDSQTMLERIQVTGHTILQARSLHGPNAGFDDDQVAEITEMMQYLESSVVAACEILQEYLSRSTRNSRDNSSSSARIPKNGGNGAKVQTVCNDNHYESSKRLIDSIFYDDLDEDNSSAENPSETDSQDEFELDSDEDEDVDREENVQVRSRSMNDFTLPPTTAKKQPPKPKLSSEQLQKQQEEMLEKEISQMAAQLKNSSLAIKQTLQSQNQNLDEMETLAQENLDRTIDVKDKVTEQVNRGWRKSVGRWVTFFVILGTWTFCFLTIRVVPKRKGACLLFCGDKKRDRDDYGSHLHDDAHGYHDYDGSHSHSGSHDDERDHSHGHDSGEKRKFNAKYSYCQDSDDENGKRNQQCTGLLDEQQHHMKMNHFDSPGTADWFAFSLVEENKERRREANMKKAMTENDADGSSRVRDGWDGYDESAQMNEPMVDEDDAIHEAEDMGQDDDYYYDADEGMGIPHDGEDSDLDYEYIDLEDAVKYGDLDKIEEILAKHPEFADKYYDYVDYDDDGYDGDETSAGNEEPFHEEDINRGGVDVGVEEQRDASSEQNEEMPNDSHPTQYTNVDLRRAIHSNDIVQMRAIVSANPDIINVGDENGWTSVHEAIRMGNVEMMHLLVERYEGDLNAQIRNGGSALWLAREFHHDPNHPILKFMTERGAELVNPAQMRKDEL